MLIVFILTFTFLSTTTFDFLQRFRFLIRLDRTIALVLGSEILLDEVLILNALFAQDSIKGFLLSLRKSEQESKRMSLSGSHKKTLLVRPPSHLLSSGVVTHIQDERNSVSYQLAQSQWNDYKQIFSQKGWEIKQILKQDECSDGVFVEDALVYFSKPLSGSEDKDKRGLIVLCQAGHPSRKPERTTVESTLRELKNGDNDNDFNNFDVEEIKSPGTLDGGDVLKIEKESVVYVGSGSRTNAEGIKQLRILLCKRGYSVVAVPMTKALHLSKLYLLKRHSYPLELFKFIEIDPSYSFCLATFYFFRSRLNQNLQ